MMVRGYNRIATDGLLWKSKEHC